MPDHPSIRSGRAKQAWPLSGHVTARDRLKVVPTIANRKIDEKIFRDGNRLIGL